MHLWGFMLPLNQFFCCLKTIVSYKCTAIFFSAPEFFDSILYEIIFIITSADFQLMILKMTIELSQLKIAFLILKWTDFNIVNVNIDQVVQKSTVNEYGKFLQNCPAWQYYSFFVW